jgi:uracil-DNA glycosylase
MQFSFPSEINHLRCVLPPRHQTFRAFELCPFDKVKVIILGQDPYPNVGDANGLAFSVNKGQELPRSLKNIFTELVNDIGCEYPTHGDLTAWASQGVLLANTALSTLEGKPAAHASFWKEFTSDWISKLGKQEKPIVWVLWGAYAQSYKGYIGKHHKIITSAHPSPLSARGFFWKQSFF